MLYTFGLYIIFWFILSENAARKSGINAISGGLNRLAAQISSEFL